MLYALDDIVYINGGKHMGRIGLFKGTKEQACLIELFNKSVVVYKGYVAKASEAQKKKFTSNPKYKKLPQITPAQVSKATAGLSTDPNQVLESGETISEALTGTGN